MGAIKSFLYNNRKYILMIIDIAVVIFSYFISTYFFMSDGNFDAYLSRFQNTYYIYATIFILVFFMFRTYESMWRYAEIEDFFMCIFASITASALFILYVKMFEIQMSIRVLALATAFSAVALTGIRMAYRYYYKRKTSFQKQDNTAPKTNLLIIGAGTAAILVKNEIVQDRHSRYHIVGFVDDDKSKIGRIISGIKVYGKISEIAQIASDTLAEKILIAIPSVSDKRLDEIISLCLNTNLKMKILPSLNTLDYSEARDRLSGNAKSLIKQIKDVNIEDLLGRSQIELDNHELQTLLSKKVVMVTGGGGSIGSELCRQIARADIKELVILDNYENNAYDIEQELKIHYPKLKIDAIIADVSDYKKLDSIFDEKKPDYIYHAAARKHVPLMERSPYQALYVNVLGTRNVIELADKHKAQKLVIISTDKAVNPTSIMGASKRITEMLMQAYVPKGNTKYSAVRFGNVLGSNGSVIPLFKRQIADGGPVTVTHKDMVRYFMTIKEAVALILNSALFAKGGEIFVLDMGRPVKINDLAENLIRLSGLRPHIDIKIEYTGLRPGEKLYEELLMSEEGLQNTDNKKIFIAKPQEFSYNDLNQKIDKLVEDIKYEDNIILVKEKISEIVDTYTFKK